MSEEAKKAIAFLESSIKEGSSSDDALKFSQAALNLANCEAVRDSFETTTGAI